MPKHWYILKSVPGPCKHVGFRGQVVRIFANMKDDQVMKNHVKVWRKLSEAVTRMRFSVTRHLVRRPDYLSARLDVFAWTLTDYCWLLSVGTFCWLKCITNGCSSMSATKYDKCIGYALCWLIEAETKWPPEFPDDIFKCIFLTENVIISIKISLKFVPKGSINNIPTLVQIMAWRRPGDKPLSEPMMVRLSTHICVTRPQWV